MKKESWFSLAILALLTISILVGLRDADPSPDATVPGPDALIGSKKGVAIMNVYGPIFVSGTSQFSTLSGVDEWVAQLEEIEEDRRVKALLIRINSPGGTVGASQELYAAIARLKKNTDIPVIISIADVAASGGYWTAMAGDYIFANPGSIVGNIGVIINQLDFSNLSDRYGVKMKSIKSGKYKDLFSPWRPSSSDERRLVQGIVDNVYEQFLTVFTQSRKLDRKTAKTLADGRIFSGEQALEAGLVDALGTFQDAIAYAAKEGGIEGKPTIIIKSGNPMQQFIHYWRRRVGQSLFGFGTAGGMQLR